MPWVWLPRRRKRPPRRRRATPLPPPPPPPPPRRRLPPRLPAAEEEGLDLGDVARYGGAAALGAGAALLFAYRDKIVKALKGKDEVTEEEVRKAVEDAVAGSGGELSEEDKEEIVRRVLEELRGE